MLQDRAAQEEERLVRKDHGVAGLEARFVFGAVDVAGDDA